METNDKHPTNSDEEKVFDYLGNEIKEGMTIKTIRTKPFWSECQVEEIRIGGAVKIGKPIKSPDRIWECTGEYLVIKDTDDGKLRLLINLEEKSFRFLLTQKSLFFGDDILTIKGISDTDPQLNNQVEKIALFIASNDLPPSNLLYGNQNQPLPGPIARKYLNEFNEWKHTQFAYCIPVNGTVAEFIPVRKEDSDKKISDFRYIFKI